MTVSPVVSRRSGPRPERPRVAPSEVSFTTAEREFCARVREAEAQRFADRVAGR